MAAIVLPCALIALIGYQWLRLEREATARRGKEAAEAEAARIRKELFPHLSAVAEEAARSWNSLPSGRPPLAPPPLVPEIVASAYAFSLEGKLLYPDYEGAYQQATSGYESATARAEWQRMISRAEALEARGELAEARRVLEAALPSVSEPHLRATVLLRLGRLSLAAKRYGEAEVSAQRVLQCCAAARDEYGVSFALYAADQIISAWEAHGRLRASFPRLASQLGELLRQGEIGHPRDIQDIAALAARDGGGPDASLLVRQAEEQAKRVSGHIETGKRLERWVSGTVLAGPRRAGFSLHTLWIHERPRLAGVHQSPDGLLVTLFAAGPLATWLTTKAAEEGHFEAVLSPKDEYQGSAILRTALLPEAPGFELVLRPREADPATQRWRQRLFAGALAAAVLLVLVVGYFASRDVSRELKLSSLRSTFVSSVTHELKTPLTSIRLLAETLRLKRTRDPAVADQLLGAMVDESERLARLVDNVLSFSRIERGAHRYRPASIDLSEAVGDAVRRFQYILKQGEFRLHQESDGEPLRVYADAEALGQALLNLLDNAVKYSGVSREIGLGIHRLGEEAEIRVTDYGIGIPRSDQRHIFESFYRAPGAVQETTGAGLGLALVRHFTEAHDGRMTVTSEPGKGSTFSLWLPLMRDDGQDSRR